MAKKKEPKKVKNVIKWERGQIEKGFYATREQAERRATRLRNEGYNVEISPAKAWGTKTVVGYAVFIDGYIPVQRQVKG